MAEAGASIVLCGRRMEMLEQVASVIRATGAKVLPVKTDVSRKDEVDAMAARALAEFGRVDVLVNNAGINIVRPFLKLQEEEWDAVLNTNLKGCYYCCQAMGRGMVEQRSGSIINMV